MDEEIKEFSRREELNHLLYSIMESVQRMAHIPGDPRQSKLTLNSYWQTRKMILRAESIARELRSIVAAEALKNSVKELDEMLVKDKCKDLEEL